MSEESKAPKELDAIVDKVLAYRPKPKSEAAKVRKRKTAKAKRQNKILTAPTVP
jgi:hypothetical protein